MAANYVSFTLIEEGDIPSKNKKEGFKNKNTQKERFFKTFYDTIAQSVFYSLFYAFPKSRAQLDNDMKRKLLNIFSKLFTGMKIKSAKFEHWQLDLGAGNIMAGTNPKKAKTEILSLADIDKPTKKSVTKSKRERVHMKYSPLVERYLMSHKYETMNNVREWKMLLTQRTDIQKEIDAKFEKYKKIAQQSLETKN